MNRVDRLMAIVVQLQSRRLVKAEELAHHFEISVRTVYRDIAALGEAGVPIMAEPGVGYSLVKGYQLPPVMFTSEEASALFIGGKLVHQLTDASLRKQMDSALLKIRSILPRDRQDHLERLERLTAVIPQAVNANPRMQSEALIPIQHALADRHVLALDYQGGQSREITHRLVEPLGLIYYADNWHLIAYCRLRCDVRDFRTDRIQKLQVRSERFSSHADFSLKAYLQSTRESIDAQLVQVRFLPQAMDRVRREWYFGFVEAAPDGEAFAAMLLACSLEEIARWILSFGTMAQVIAPEGLKILVAEAARDILCLYAPAHRPLECLLT